MKKDELRKEIIIRDYIIPWTDVHWTISRYLRGKEYNLNNLSNFSGCNINSNSEIDVFGNVWIPNFSKLPFSFGTVDGFFGVVFNKIQKSNLVNTAKC